MMFQSQAPCLPRFCPHLRLRYKNRSNRSKLSNNLKAPLAQTPGWQQQTIPVLMMSWVSHARLKTYSALHLSLPSLTTCTSCFHFSALYASKLIRHPVYSKDHTFLLSFLSLICGGCTDSQQMTKRPQDLCQTTIHWDKTRKRRKRGMQVNTGRCEYLLCMWLRV